MNTVHFDEQGIGSGAREIRWDELVAVGILTTSDGPFVEDVYWQFLLSDGVVELPGSVVDGGALDIMQRRLVGLDSLKIASAMGSTKERIFRVWHVEESKWRWDDAAFADRFEALVRRLGGQAAQAHDVFRRLRRAWSAEERRYHDLQHLADCLRELDEASAQRGTADMAELALWYHDAVQEPRAGDCEERSAAMLREDGASLGLRRDSVLAAEASVRATAHFAGATRRGPAADLAVDIDLSILGRDVLRFMEFEYAVAEEYASVPAPTYFLARGRFLAALLASPSIFRTEHFRERYEARARSNIAALLRSPRYRAHRWLGRVYRWLT
jgi:predicted metal-dependent HD superfamily phosphohydrolase